MSDGFFKHFNESESGQLLTTASKFCGVAGFAIGIVQGIMSLNKPSDVDTILGAIEDLQFQIQKDFKHLGDLIRQQTQLIIQEVDRDAMATALSHSNAALNCLSSFLETKDDDDLHFAWDESSVGIGFFLELGGPPLDPFFLPGLVKAGVIRVSVIAVRDPNFFTRSLRDVNEIRKMIDYLESTIRRVKQQVNAAHIVLESRERIPGGPPSSLLYPPVYRHCYIHVERVTDAQGNTTSYRDVGDPYHKTGLPTPQACTQAGTLAEKDRSAGVANELAYIGIPGFEAILQDWKTMVGMA